MTLEERFAAIEARIGAACARAGRPREAVRLVAVSKLQSMAAIRAAFDLGQRDFGENYAQELRDKHTALASLTGLRWHAIGPLQPKNAKYVAKAADVFHALDRLDTAAELSRRRLAPPLRCLLEVNVAAETTKSGVTASQLEAFAQHVRALPNLELVGLTCLPPSAEDPEASRPHFRALKRLAAALGVHELSMGSTQDFEVAIEEGATWVRVGTALFGERS
jgi:pyridoxal phosphate enzyme (YggS family)